jgi:hypothetical protein
MHPSGGRGVQLFFVVKVIQLVDWQLTVVTTNELKHDFFGSQNGITSGTIDELLDALVYSSLFVLSGNSIRTQKAIWCSLRDNQFGVMIQSYWRHTESLVVTLPSRIPQDLTSVLGAENRVETM